MRPEHVSLSEAGGRREAEGRARSPSPSFSGSYVFEGDDDYDSEEEARGRESDRGSATERSVHDPAPISTSSMAQQPKPKRTRQLTTPHQSAVLHALLAQSRFPTTQMREEVGRQIGLSARKVQVWFQNQRQKARKESREAAAAAAAGGGSVAARSIPPQFGPFTNVPPPPGGQPITSAVLGEGASSSRTRTRQGGAGEPSITITHERVPGPSFSRFGPMPESYAHASAPSRRASEPALDIYSSSNTAALRRSSGGDLTGPGVPGSGGTVDPLSQRRGSALPSVSSAQYSRPLSPEQPPRLPPVYTLNPSLSPPGRHEARTQSSSTGYRAERLEPESSLRLPPIQPRPTDQQRHEAFGSHTYPAPSAGHSTLARIPPPRTPISLPSPSAGRGIRPLSPATPPPIPPPFTLEPSPLWQTPPVISSRARTQSGSTSRSTPSAGPSGRTMGANETLMERHSGTLPPPTRTMRFDPVRNTEIAAIQSPGRAHSRSSNEDN